MMESSGSPERPQQPYINPADLPKQRKQITAGPETPSGEITVPGSGDSDVDDFRADWAVKVAKMPPEVRNFIMRHSGDELYASRHVYETTREDEPLGVSPFERFRDAFNGDNILNSAAQGEQGDPLGFPTANDQPPTREAQSAQEQLQDLVREEERAAERSRATGAAALDGYTPTRFETALRNVTDQSGEKPLTLPPEADGLYRLELNQVLRRSPLPATGGEQQPPEQLNSPAPQHPERPHEVQSEPLQPGEAQ